MASHEAFGASDGVEAALLANDVQELFQAHAFDAGVFQPDDLEAPTTVVLGGVVDDGTRRAAVHIWQTIVGLEEEATIYIAGCHYALTPEGPIDRSTETVLGHAALVDIRQRLRRTQWNAIYSEALAANRATA